MATVARIIPSVSITIEGTGPVTLDNLQSFIEEAQRLGIAKDKILEVSLAAPFHYDQRDSSPGSMTITAS